MKNSESGTRTIHGIKLERESDGSYAVTMPDRWFSCSPENDAEDNLEGELCMLLDHLWDAAVPAGLVLGDSNFARSPAIRDNTGDEMPHGVKAAPRVNIACGVHGPLPCVGAGCVCANGVKTPDGSQQ
jgi:hypothetical protein